MGDAQSSADEAAMNFDMLAFYSEFMNKIGDDQSRFDGNHPDDKGALADVVPFDGIGGNPGCPIWQVAYIVIGRQLWKHYGEMAIPTIRRHYAGMRELLDWFDRHASADDGLLVIQCYGDWMGFNPESHNGGSSQLTPRDAVTAFHHVLAMKYMAEMATALGKTADAAELMANHTRGVAAYHKRYYNETVGGYSPCAEFVPDMPLSCPQGQVVDYIVDDGDDGSCECAKFCASDWSNSVHKHRRNWVGATSPFVGTPRDNQTPCVCVQGEHYCLKGKHGCDSGCAKKGVPKPKSYCVPAASRPSKCHGTSSHGSQTSNVMALALGAPPDIATTKRVLANLAADVMSFGNKTTCGVTGIAWLLPILDAGGHSDIAISLLLNDAYPSLGHMAHQNMTTLCENYACTFHDAGGGSQNHIMLGGWNTWLLASVGGLDSEVTGTSAGWSHVIVRVAPAALTMIGHSSYTKITRFGPTSLDWTFANNKFESNLTVPVGSTATTHMHSHLIDNGETLGLRSVSESGVVVWSEDEGRTRELPEGVGDVRQTPHSVLVDVASGQYTFTAHYAKKY